MLKARLLALLLAAALLAGCSSSQPAAPPSSTSPDDPPTTQTADAPADSDADSGQANDAQQKGQQAKGQQQKGQQQEGAEETPASDVPSDVEDNGPDTRLADATESAPNDWQHRSASSGDLPGIGTHRAYESVLQGRDPKQTVVVAVIDSGVDIEHDDLDDNIWVNEDEVPDNGVDDDGNGYVDDVHGWNFLGNPSGENIDHAPMELTRLVRELGDTFENVDSASVKPEYREDFNRYQTLKQKLDRMRASKQNEYSSVRNAYEALKYSTQMLQRAMDTDSLSLSKVRNLTSPRRDLQRARDIYIRFVSNDLTLSDIEEYKTDIEEQLRYGYDLTFNPRPIVGDDPDDLSERFYGNNDVTGPDAFHGTHVAGIIAAERNNGLGIDGVAESTRIMALRAVPNGDERDKDVANAIRYAAENGADIINMSFGKDYSPHKGAVDDAVRYADSLGVLLVHAAGNDGANVDSTDNYPSGTYLTGEKPDAWITVGASSWTRDQSLVASFSNFGAERVDLFAPGVDIYSTTPNQTYERVPGTSMAAPMVSGAAALIMAHYPELSATEVRRLLLDSATQYPEQMVTRPGGDDPVPFTSLSASGGVLNVVQALKAAETMTAARTP